MTAQNRWLTDMLISRGVMSEGGLTRSSRLRYCPTCRGLALAGISSIGFDCWADPRPLTRRGEALALLAGLRTFDLARDGQLVIRSASRIAWLPADAVTVVTVHRCDIELPAEWLDADARYAGSKPVRTPPPGTDETPPF